MAKKLNLDREALKEELARRGEEGTLAKTHESFRILDTEHHLTIYTLSTGHSKAEETSHHFWI